MSEDQPRRRPTARRYSPEEKAQAVRLVRQLRAELGTDHGTVQRIAGQLGYGVESVRNWVHQADVDEGAKQGLSTDERAELVRLRRELRVKDMEIEILKRANSILKSASAFFAAELDRPHR